MSKNIGYVGFLPIVHTENLQATAEYYRDVLGFSIDENLVSDDFVMLWAPGGDDTWHQLGLMNSGKDHQPGRGQVIGVAVEGIDEIFAAVKEQGAKILFAIEDRPWSCREFGVEDPNGYHLYFRECGP